MIEYADTVAGLGEHDFAAQVAAGSRLTPFLVALSDAQFAYTGNGGPLGLLRAWDVDDDDEDGDAEQTRGPGLSVLQRADYRVVDETAVIEAGRAAYKEVWPNATDEDAAADVTAVARALYQIAHASGSWSSVEEIDGIDIAGRVTVVVSTEGTLASEVDEWPDDVFEHDADRVIYRQDDVYL